MGMWCRFGHGPARSFPKDSPISAYFYCIFSCLGDNAPLIFLQPAISLLSLDCDDTKLKQRVPALGYFSIY